MKMDKTATQPDVLLSSRNRPTLRQCRKEGVVLCVIVTLNVSDDSDELCMFMMYEYSAFQASLSSLK